MPSRTVPSCVITLRIPNEDALPTSGLKVHFCPVTTRTDSVERRSLRSPPPPPPQSKAEQRAKFTKALPKLRPLKLFH